MKKHTYNMIPIHVFLFVVISFLIPYAAFSQESKTTKTVQLDDSKQILKSDSIVIMKQLEHSNKSVMVEEEILSDEYQKKIIHDKIYYKREKTQIKINHTPSPK